MLSSFVGVWHCSHVCRRGESAGDLLLYEDEIRSVEGLTGCT
jgi:hypothetical protein